MSNPVSALAWVRSQRAARHHWVTTESRAVREVSTAPRISEGVDISGNNALVEKNKINVVEDCSAIEVDGDNAEVVKNNVANTDNYGIYVTGNNALVSRNRARNMWYAIDVEGDSPVVEKNRISDVIDGDGVYVSCTICTDGSVSKNKVTNVADDTEGYDISATGAGLMIQKNRATRVVDYAFNLDVNGATVSNNKASYSGGDKEECFSINGDDNDVSKNTANWCMGDGFSLQGDNNTLFRNKAIRNGRNGFTVESGSDGNLLEKNTARLNSLIGLMTEDGAPAANDTTFTGNTSKKNQFDVCDDGSNTVDGGGNKIDTEQIVTGGDDTDECISF